MEIFSDNVSACTVKLVLRGHGLTRTPRQLWTKSLILMYRQIFAYLPPHMWTNSLRVDGEHQKMYVDSGHQKMYCGTKIHSFTWTPICYFFGCHGSFNELGLKWPQFMHKEHKDQREKCELHISRRICDNININKCEKTFEKVEKLIFTVWIIGVSHIWTPCQLWTLDGVRWSVRIWKVLLYAHGIWIGIGLGLAWPCVNEHSCGMYSETREYHSCGQWMVQVIMECWNGRGLFNGVQ